MLNQNLKQIIKEIGEELSILPKDQIADLVAQLIDDLLPLAILSMPEDSINVDDSERIKEEFHERRTWGKDRYNLEETIMQRRELLEHVRMAKSSTDVISVSDHGSLLLLAPQTAMARVPLTRQSSTNIETEYVSDEISSENLAKLSRPYLTKNIQFVVDNSLLEKLNDGLFAKFCFCVEKTSRHFTMMHMNEFIFTLKERNDVELPDWKRTVLYVRFPKMRFDAVDKLWSTLSNEVRSDLNKISKQLTTDEQMYFTDLINNFNVEMDY